MDSMDYYNIYFEQMTDQENMYSFKVIYNEDKML